MATNPGFDAQGLTVVSPDFSEAGLDSGQMIAYRQEWRRRAAENPSISGVALASVIPPAPWTRDGGSSGAERSRLRASVRRFAASMRAVRHFHPVRRPRGTPRSMFALLAERVGGTYVVEAAWLPMRGQPPPE